MMHPSIDRERQKIARQYFKEHLVLDISDAAVSLTCLLLLILSGLSVQFVSWTRGASPSFLVRHSLYFLAFYAIFYLVSLPLSYLSSYRTEQKYGFSNQTLRAWGMDKVKGFLVGLVFGWILFHTFYWIVLKSPGLWWLWTGLVFLLFSVILANLAPVLLIPLFYKYAPLEDGELKQKLVDLARKAGVRIIGVYNLRLSEKTKKANAALAGLGNTRRMLLGDNLLKDYEQDEIETVIAHELGHHLHYHILKQILIGAVLTIGEFFLIFKLSSSLLSLMNLPPIENVASFPGLVLIFGVLQFLLTPLHNGISRSFERQSDRTAVLLTDKPRAFISTMAKFANLYLSLAYPPALIEWYRYSHPSIGRRIQMAEDFVSKVHGP